MSDSDCDADGRSGDAVRNAISKCINLKPETDSLFSMMNKYFPIRSKTIIYAKPTSVVTEALHVNITITRVL